MKKVFRKTGRDFVDGKNHLRKCKKISAKNLKRNTKRSFAALLEREHFVNLVDDFHVILRYLSKDAKNNACIIRMYDLFYAGFSPKEVVKVMEGKK